VATADSVAVLDASAWVDLLLPGPAHEIVERRLREHDEVYVLDLTPLEVLNGLRRAERRRGATWDEDAVSIVHDPSHLVFPATVLARRVWDLRATHTAFDAAYVALAEILDAPLLTTDRRLARSHGHKATIIDCSTD